MSALVTSSDSVGSSAGVSVDMTMGDRGTSGYATAGGSSERFLPLSGQLQASEPALRALVPSTARVQEQEPSVNTMTPVPVSPVTG